MNRVPLASIASPGGLVGGPFGSSLVSSDYVDNGIPVIRGTNMSAGRFVGGDFAYVSSEKFQKDLARNSAAPGDVVFTQRGTLGQVALVPSQPHEVYVVSQSQMRLRVDATKADPCYVYFAATAHDFLKQIDDNAISTGVPHTNLGILAKLTIPLPSLPEQQAIAEVLGALDDKITANTALATTTWSLAGGEFESLQRRPGTRRATLGDVASLEYGRSLPAAVREEGEVLVVGSGGVSGTHSTALVPQSGVVVGRKGSAGSVLWIDGPHFPIDTTFFVRGLHEAYSQPYLYFLLRTLRLNEMNGDSAVPGLNRAEALALPIRLPDTTSLARFTTTAEALIAAVAVANRENRTLAATRDALLPQLMSGKLRVRDAERIASEAGA